MPDRGSGHPFHRRLNAAQAPRPRGEREGLHPDRAAGRDPDHRHPCRDRSARVPEPALEGAGHRGQVGRPYRADRDGDVVHRRADVRRRHAVALRNIEPALEQRCRSRGQPRDPGTSPTAYKITVTQAKTGSVFTIAKADQRLRRAHVPRRGQEGCPKPATGRTNGGGILTRRIRKTSLGPGARPDCEGRGFCRALFGSLGARGACSDQRFVTALYTDHRPGR